MNFRIYRRLHKKSHCRLPYHSNFFSKLTTSILEVCFSLVKNKIDLSERGASVRVLVRVWVHIHARLHACSLIRSFIQFVCFISQNSFLSVCSIFLLFNTSMILYFASTKLVLVFNFYSIFFILLFFGAHRANTKQRSCTPPQLAHFLQSGIK